MRVKPGLVLTERIGETEVEGRTVGEVLREFCLLYTSDAADE